MPLVPKTILPLVDIDEPTKNYFMKSIHEARLTGYEELKDISKFCRIPYKTFMHYSLFLLIQLPENERRELMYDLNLSQEDLQGIITRLLQ